MYDNALRLVDEQVDELIKKLTRANGNKSTLFIIAADHGEMMGEHGYCFNHGWFLYEPLIKVPFIVYAPGLIPAGKISAQVRAGLDIFPTLLSFLGIKNPRPSRASLFCQRRLEVTAAFPPTF